ncbi:MAG TPA: hypothetical protein DCL21_02670 [Alphaproteobacteria bacterium]|nr:hypothetical protein [Alphaproteobacteria bacterium]
MPPPKARPCNTDITFLRHRFALKMFAATKILDIAAINIVYGETSDSNIPKKEAIEAARVIPNMMRKARIAKNIMFSLRFKFDE